MPMARVFQGNVEIPGEKLGEYFQALEDAERANAPLRQHLTQLNREFERFLLQKVSAKTTRKHTNTIDLFIDFLCWRTDVQSIAEITRGMAKSYFRRWYRSKVGRSEER